MPTPPVKQILESELTGGQRWNVAMHGGMVAERRPIICSCSPNQKLAGYVPITVTLERK